RLSLFDVATPSKLFFMRPDRAIEEFDFGPVLPTGLTRAELIDDLTTNGAFFGGGATKPWVLSVDGDISMDEAVATAFAEVPKTGSVVGYTWIAQHAEIELPTTSPVVHSKQQSFVDILTMPKWHLDIAYRWAPTPTDDILPLNLREHANVQFLYNDGTERVAGAVLEPCEELCHATVELPNWDQPAILRLLKNSSNSPLIIEQLDAYHGPISATHQSFELTVPAGQFHSYEIVGAEHLGSSELRDADGNLITNSPSFQLAGPAEGESHYTLDVVTGSWYVTIGVQAWPSDPHADEANQMSFAGISVGSLSIVTERPIDARMCAAGDIAIGDVAVNGAYMRATRRAAEFVMWQDVPAGEYPLAVTPGRCLDTSGRPLDVNGIVVDLNPPQLVSNSLKVHSTIPAGYAYLALQFNEPLQSNGRLLPDEFIHVLDDTGRIVSGLAPVTTLASDNTIMVALGELGPGNYQLVFDQAFEVSDVSLNSVSLEDQFAFTVTPADELSPYDLNLDHVVDYSDLLFLRDNRWIGYQLGIPQFDVNGDGELDETDDQAWAKAVWHQPAGDVDLDGDFDEADLALLSALAVGGLGRDADWLQGDFDFDGLFTTDDLILAMQGGMS
ncbi:MAG: hypothetical protein KDB23_23825, partial [Planctomycetales bacterium]|nr:hypothetical protein [Planctomycetales bacterium]